MRADVRALLHGDLRRGEPRDDHAERRAAHVGEARVMEEVDQTLKHDIPATVLVIEAWSDEMTFYIWNDAKYTPSSSNDASSTTVSKRVRSIEPRSRRGSGPIR